MSELIDDIKDWIEKADHDLGSAKVIYLHLPDYIDTIAFHCQQAVEKYLKAFDVFTLTSITEALPYALLEAGQAGLPIIASGVGGIPEIIDDMLNGILVRPKEPEEISKAIDYLIQNPDKMAQFGHNINLKIIKDFTKETMVKETVKLYN